MSRFGYRIAAVWLGVSALSAIGAWQTIAPQPALAVTCIKAPCGGGGGNNDRIGDAKPVAAAFPAGQPKFSGEMRMMLGVIRCFRAPCPAPDYEIRNKDRTFTAKVHTIVVRTNSTGQIKSYTGRYFTPTSGDVLVEGDLWIRNKTAFVSSDEGIRERPRQ